MKLYQQIKPQKLHNLEDDISIKKYYDDLLEDNKYVGKKVARTVEEIKNKRKGF